MARVDVAQPASRHPTPFRKRMCLVSERTAESVLTLAGDVDFASVVWWQRRIGEALRPLPTVLVLDLARVSFMDSSGVNLLIAARRMGLAQDTRIRLRNKPAQVERLLSISGMDRVF